MGANRGMGGPRAANCLGTYRGVCKANRKRVDRYSLPPIGSAGRTAALCWPHQRPPPFFLLQAGSVRTLSLVPHGSIRTMYPLKGGWAGGNMWGVLALPWVGGGAGWGGGGWGGVQPPACAAMRWRGAGGAHSVRCHLRLQRQAGSLMLHCTALHVGRCPCAARAGTIGDSAMQHLGTLTRLTALDVFGTKVRAGPVGVHAGNEVMQSAKVHAGKGGEAGGDVAVGPSRFNFSNLPPLPPPPHNISPRGQGASWQGGGGT